MKYILIYFFIFMTFGCSSKSVSLGNDNAAFAILIDKSGSMKHHKKLENAKQAAKSAILKLRPNDHVGLIGFDNHPFVVIDFKRKKDIVKILNKRLGNLYAVGSTHLLPSISVARNKLKRINSSTRHILILSDGKVKNKSACTLEVKKHINSGGTLSTVALGKDADRTFLSSLAGIGKGKYYSTQTPSKLPTFFIEDVQTFVSP